MVGRLVRTVWLVGGIVRGDFFEAFMEIVPNRSSTTLNEVILRNVEEGSTIMTDCWAGYKDLTIQGFAHFCVNHSYNFLNPLDHSIHTQKIESTWNSLKSFLRRKGTNLTNHLDEYFVEYLYRRKMKYIFMYFCEHVGMTYKVNSD